MDEEEIKRKMKEYYEQAPASTNYTKLILIILVVLIIIAIIAAVAVLVVIPMMNPEPVCGNGVVEENENCFDCSKDVPCSSGQICSPDTKQCITTECGNAVCELGESKESCCDDCGCQTQGETCNITTHQCSSPASNMSSQSAELFIRQYFEKYNRTVISINITGPATRGGKPVVAAKVNVSNETFLASVYVYEDGNITEDLVY